jgi:putative ABC transport system ATP-binding protein
MTKIVMKTEGLTKVYDNNTRALNGIDLLVRKGEWVSIMGPSGSGKTTLLNIIGGLDKPSKGLVRISGTEITGLNSKELTRFRRENIGFIFQQFHLVPYLTALENVLLAQYFHSIVVEKEAIEALERVGLKHRLTHLPTQMSGGEQQRVAVARALANEPDILLADEPTGNLDQKNGKMVLDLLQSLNDEGNTILMITHDLKIAKRGERIIKLIDGKIFKDTTLKST